MADMQLNILISAQNAASTVIRSLAADLGATGGVAIAAAAALAGVGMALGASVKAAADFQTGLTVLSTGAGELQSNLQLVGNGIKQISIDTGTSTQQLLSGMFMIESAGYRGADALNVLRVASQGAKNENADLGAVAFSLTGLLHDYGMKSTEAAQAMNALIVTESSGKMHMQDLTTSLGNVLPLASTLKVAYPQIGAAIAVMTNANMTARRATQNLNFELRALSAPSATAVKAMQSVGLSAQQVSDTLRKQGLAATIQLITDAVGKKFPAGSVEWTNAMKAINGGATGLNVALMLSGSHMKEFKTDITNITAAMNNGKTGVMNWAQTQGTFNFKMDQAKAALNVLMINIGTKLLPILSQLLTAVTPLITNFANFVNTLNRNSPAIAIFGGILAGLATIILVTVVPAFWAWAVATIAATWPLLLIALVVAAVVAGIILAIQHWGQIVAWLKGVWAAFSSWFGGIMSAIGTFFHTVWNDIIGFFTMIWNAIVDFAKAHALLLLSVITGPIGALVIYIVTNWNQIWSFLTSLWNNIVSFARTTWNNLVSAIQSAASAIWNAITQPFRDAWNWITNLFGGLGTWLHNTLANMPVVGGILHSVGIPGFATGGTTPGGPILVGEKGPEIILPPRGSQVIPLSGASGMGSHSTSGGGTIHIGNLTINAMHREHTPQELATKVLDEISRKLNRSGGFVTNTSGGRAF